MNSMDHCDINDVRDALQYLDSSDRDTWVEMAFAIKSEFGQAGFSTWDDWSRGWAKYREKDARSTWRSAKVAGGSGTIRIGTLFRRAMDAGYQQRPMSDDERQRLSADWQARQQKIKQEQAADIMRQQKLRRAVEGIVPKILEHTGAVGSSQYLGAKKVQAHGLRFFKQMMVLITDEEAATVQLISDPAQAREFVKTVDRDKVSFKIFKSGSFALPMRNAGGQLMNLQVIYPTGKKSFLTGAAKQGHWAMIGPDVEQVLLISEGYATGASGLEATGCPVAVAFDAGNLMPVAQSLRQLYPAATLIFLADDDRDTEGNPGLSKANAAAGVVGGFVAVPDFAGVIAA